MDHAGDVTRRLLRGYAGHPYNGGDGLGEPEWSRERCTFCVFTSDGGAFRVTVEDVGYDALTREELHGERWQLDPSDPLYVAPEPVPRHVPTHELLADGSLRKVPPNRNGMW